VDHRQSDEDLIKRRDLPTHPLDKFWHLSVDGKLYGPFTGHELRSMARNGEFAPSDYIIEQDGHNWEQAGDANIVKAFFSAPKIAGDVRRIKRSYWSFWSVCLWLLAPAALLLWVAWPYYSVYMLIEGARVGNVAILENGVEWDAVRQGIKNDINAQFMKEQVVSIEKDKSPGNQLGTGIAMMLGPTVLNQLIDSMVTPSAFADAIHQSNAQNKSLSNERKVLKNPNELRWERIQYAFFSGGPLSFMAKLDIPGSKNAETVDFLFRWNGNWRLSRVYLPPSVWNSNELFNKAAAIPPTTPTVSTPPVSRNVSLSESDILGLRKKLAQCWSPPSDAVMPVRVRMLLKRDGYLAAEPMVVADRSMAGVSEEMKKSAVAAVRACQPFALPAAKYEAWKDIEINFDPTSSVETK
jgi:hypothetical protein